MCCDLLGRRLWYPSSTTTTDDRTILENEIITNVGSIIQVIYEAIVNVVILLLHHQHYHNYSYYDD